MERRHSGLSNEEHQEALRARIRQWFQTHYYDFRDPNPEDLRRFLPEPAPLQQHEGRGDSLPRRFAREKPDEAVIAAIATGDHASPDTTAKLRGIMGEILGTAVLQHYGSEMLHGFSLQVAPGLYEPADIVLLKNAEVEGELIRVLGGFDIKTGKSPTSRTNIQDFPVSPVTLHLDNLGIHDMLRRFEKGNIASPAELLMRELGANVKRTERFLQSTSDSLLEAAKKQHVGGQTYPETRTTFSELLASAGLAMKADLERRQQERKS